MSRRMPALAKASAILALVVAMIFATPQSVKLWGLGWFYYFSRDGTQGLRAVPMGVKDIDAYGCSVDGLSWMADADYEVVLRVGIPFPRDNIVQSEKPLPEWRRVEYADGKVIALAGRLPTYDEFADARSEQAPVDVESDTLRPLLERAELRSKWDLTKRVLEMSPGALRVFRDRSAATLDFTFLMLKKGMVPADADAVYTLQSKKHFRGFQAGDPGHGKMVFLHLFDESDAHYQIVLKNFDEPSLGCWLSLVSAQ